MLRIKSTPHVKLNRVQSERGFFHNLFEYFLLQFTVLCGGETRHELGSLKKMESESMNATRISPLKKKNQKNMPLRRRTCPRYAKNSPNAIKIVFQSKRLFNCQFTFKNGVWRAVKCWRHRYQMWH